MTNPACFHGIGILCISVLIGGSVFYLARETAPTETNYMSHQGNEHMGQVLAGLLSGTLTMTFLGTMYYQNKTK